MNNCLTTSYTISHATNAFNYLTLIQRPNMGLESISPIFYRSYIEVKKDHNSKIMKNHIQKHEKVNGKQLRETMIREDGVIHLFEQDRLPWHLLLHNFPSFLQLHRFPSHPDFQVKCLNPWPSCWEEALEALRRLIEQVGTSSSPIWSLWATANPLLTNLWGRTPTIVR